MSRWARAGRRVAAPACAALAVALAHPACRGDGAGGRPLENVGAAPADRVLRYPLAAFRSESAERVQVEGAWWPEFVRLPEGLRSAVVAEPGGRLRLRLAGFAGARLAGQIEARPQQPGDARAMVRIRMRLLAGGRSTGLLDRTLGPGDPVPYAFELPAELAPDAVLELATEIADGTGVLANAAWIDGAITRALPRAPGPGVRARSILLITVDTLRQDELGPYGGRTRTPALDRLAAAGATYLDVHSVAFGTAPSHASLFTSSAASQHGVFDNATVLGPASETLAEVLSAAGYSTAAFVGASVLSRSLGFDQGFDYYGDVFGLDPLAREESQYHERDAALTVTRFADWLQQQPGAPCFAWIHFYEAHQPYLPPPGWADPYLPPGSPASLPIAYPRAPDGGPVYLEERMLPPGLPLSPLAARARAGYRGEIAYVDAQVARLLDALAESGRSDAVVAFTADHGENFLEHGSALAFGHAGLHAEVTRLPLVLVAPGQIRAGERRAGLATSLDLAPTLLELAGVPTPPGWRGHSLLHAGARQAIVLEGAEREEIGVRTARWLFTLKGPVDATAPVAPAWTEPGGSAALYDLAADPGETRNVYRAGHPAAAALAALVEPFRPPPPPAAHVDSPLHAEALRALGYLR